MSSPRPHLETDPWRAANAAWLRGQLERLRLLLGRRALWLRHLWRDDDLRGERASVVGDTEVDRALAAIDGGEEEARFRSEDAASRQLTARAEALAAALAAEAADMRTRGAAPAACVLAETFHLSAFEQDLLLLCLAPELEPGLARLFAYVADDASRAYASLDLAIKLCAAPGDDAILLQDALLPSRPLRRARLIAVETGSAQPLAARPLVLERRIAHYLRGADCAEERTAAFLRPAPQPLLEEEQNGVVEALAEYLSTARSRWAVVNLIGSVEGGARDVAAAGCAAAGYRLYTLDLSVLSLPAAERRETMRLLEREAALSGMAYLLDAAALSEAAGEDGLRELVESLSAVLVVVGPRGLRSDYPTLALRLPRPDRQAQRRLWKQALAAVPHAVNGELDVLVQQFDFGPPAIAAALSTACERAATARVAVTGADLWSACRDRGGAELGDLARRLEPSHGWRDLVLPESSTRQLHELAAQVARRSRVYDEWGFGRGRRGRGITALFAGASGTGKTMPAEIVAAEIGLEIYRIDLAGVVSKYIGETEKNLRRVFDAAERSGVVLFFDEADALFSARSAQVRDSHDRYANMEVNYLLQRMEDYDGLAILATNRRAVLDQAFLRRLRFVIDFPFPTAESRLRIWQRAFPPQAALQGIDYAFLSRLEIAGGSIRAIALNAAFLAAADDGAIEMRHLLRAAGREYAKAERPLSAAEFGSYLEMVQP